MKAQTDILAESLLSLPASGHSLPVSEEEDTQIPTAVRDVHRAYTRALQETFNEYGIGIGQ